MFQKVFCQIVLKKCLPKQCPYNIFKGEVFNIILKEEIFYDKSNHIAFLKVMLLTLKDKVLILKFKIFVRVTLWYI